MRDQGGTSTSHSGFEGQV